jgi:hypothetical protein
MSSYAPEPYPGDRFRLPPRRPTSVTVIAVLHLVFGSLGFFFGLCNGVLQAVGPVNFVPQMPPPPAGTKAPPFPTDLAPRLQRYLDANCPFYNVYMLSVISLGVILSACLVAAGMGLFAVRPWARRLSLAYAIGSISLQIVSLVYMVAFTLPAMSAFYRQLEQEFPAIAPFLAFSRISMWGGLAFIPVGMVYPIVVLVLLTRRNVVAAFESRPELPAVVELDGPQHRGGPPPDAIRR